MLIRAEPISAFQKPTNVKSKEQLILKQNTKIFTDYSNKDMRELEKKVGISIININHRIPPVYYSPSRMFLRTLISPPPFASHLPGSILSAFWVRRLHWRKCPQSPGGWGWWARGIWVIWAGEGNRGEVGFCCFGHWREIELSPSLKWLRLLERESWGF